MIGKRILVCAMVALAAIASTRMIGGRAGSRSAATDGAAWALLAEAEELCRSSRARSARSEREAQFEPQGAASRRAIALEALDIVRELAQTDLEADAARVVLTTEGRLRRACTRGFLPGRPESAFPSSLDGTGSLERTALLTPFLARLNHASRALPLESPKTTVATLEPAQKSSAREPARPSIASAASPKPSKIEIAPASSEYRERLRRWALVFEREASALRASRGNLQVEIDRHSMAEARAACRGFGVVLARVDEDLIDSAPSRGLALRIERMVDRYWRGVAHCTAGRPAAAFSYLSEGDREWGTIAQMAARMFAPRPMRRPSPVAPSSDLEEGAD